jgi:3-mercaptopyruvate sulfurtransferase SseA
MSAAFDVAILVRADWVAGHLAALAQIGTLNRRVIAYCGVSATAYAFALALLGHDNITVYDGSMQEWSSVSARLMEHDVDGTVLAL